MELYYNKWLCCDPDTDVDSICSVGCTLHPFCDEITFMVYSEEYLPYVELKPFPKVITIPHGSYVDIIECYTDYLSVTLHITHHRGKTIHHIDQPISAGYWATFDLKTFKIVDSGRTDEDTKCHRYISDQCRQAIYTTCIILKRIGIVKDVRKLISEMLWDIRYDHQEGKWKEDKMKYIILEKN